MTMPSPFPGMNPYFEQPARWPCFHTKFLAAINERLILQVAPKYVVDVEEHIYIHDLPPKSRRPLGRADLSVARPEGMPAGQPALGVMAAPTPVQLQLPDQDVERVPLPGGPNPSGLGTDHGDRALELVQQAR